MRQKEYFIQKNAQASSGELLLPQAGDKTVQDVTYREGKEGRVISLCLNAGLCFVAGLKGFCIQTTSVY